MQVAVPPPGALEGIEGFRVVADGAEAGVVAALNRTSGGLVVVIDRGGETYVAVPLAAVGEVDDRRARIVLAEPLPAETVEAAVGGPSLVRSVPAEVVRLIPDTGSVEVESARWVVALLVGAVGGAMLLAAHLVVQAAGGGIAWAIFALPVLLLLVAGLLVLGGTEMSLADKIRVIPAALLGYTPRSSRGSGR